MRTLLVPAALLCLAAPARAQQHQAEVHGNFARTTQTHLQSWGGGASYQLTWGSQHAPVQIGTSLGGDYQKQENDGPSEYGVSYDVMAQPGGGGIITPYVGGSVSSNWSSGPGSTPGAKLGLQYILGAQVKLGSTSKTSVKLELRPGYVKGSEHTITARMGVGFAL